METKWSPKTKKVKFQGKKLLQMEKVMAKTKNELEFFPSLTSQDPKGMPQTSDKRK